MKKDTIKRAQKVITLMRKGISLTAAARMAKIDARSVKKAMRILKVQKKKKKGRIYLITQYYEQMIDKMIYLMSAGMSATRAAHYLRTTLPTMLKMYVVVKGRRRPLLKKTGSRYILNVYKINGYPTVFYGRLIAHTGNILGRTDIGKNDAPDDDYANIMWQIDFDPFSTTLMPDDVCKHYPEIVMEELRDFLLKRRSVNDKTVKFGKKKETIAKRAKWIADKRSEYAEDMFKIDESDVGRLALGRKVSGTTNLLDIIFGQYGVEFETDVDCGLDDRNAISEYLSPTEFKKKAKKVSEDGAFEIIVRRKNRALHYPDIPLMISVKKNLIKESDVPRSIR